MATEWISVMVSRDSQNNSVVTYSALSDVSCWKVFDSILCILLCCSPLGDEDIVRHMGG